jgi:hypothetical protein
MVLGATPYREAGPPTVFDALKAESPMIFFYSEMPPQRWYNFRHAWNMNVSVRYADLPEGFFHPEYRPVDYEDLDLAFRIMGRREGVYYDDAAVLTHRHPMTLDQYLDREEVLGLTAPSMHRINPALFAALHGTVDLARVADEFRTWVQMDVASHRWVYTRLREWCEQPATVLGQGAPRQRLIGTLYQMHIPLKRLAFRLGFLRGTELREDRYWQERRATGLWREAIGLGLG